MSPIELRGNTWYAAQRSCVLQAFLGRIAYNFQKLHTRPVSPPSSYSPRRCRTRPIALRHG